MSKACMTIVGGRLSFSLISIPMSIGLIDKLQLFIINYESSAYKIFVALYNVIYFLVTITKLNSNEIIGFKLSVIVIC